MFKIKFQLGMVDTTLKLATTTWKNWFSIKSSASRQQVESRKLVWDTPILLNLFHWTKHNTSSFYLL